MARRLTHVHARIGRLVLAAYTLTWGSAIAQNNDARHVADASIREKKLAFPSPVQWKLGDIEISLIAVAWGPANSQAMISKGSGKYAGETPEFRSDRSNALALGFRATMRELVFSELYAPSRLVRIKNVAGDIEGPSALTPVGFAPGIYDIRFTSASNTIEYWDFFPALPDQKEFLFEAPLTSLGSPTASNPRASFRIVITGGDLFIINALPGGKTVCLNSPVRFKGTVGAGSQVDLQLTREGTTLAGSERYMRVGKALELRGAADLCGNFVIEERYPEDRLVGIFEGRFSQGCRTMTGYFSKPDGSRLQPFEFRAVQAAGQLGVNRSDSRRDQ